MEYIKGVHKTFADLLSRTPQTSESPVEEAQYEPDITDRTFEINAINSNEFDPKTFASCSRDDTDTMKVPFSNNTKVDLTAEQNKDEELRKLKLQIRSGDAQKNMQEKYMIIEDVLYYISNPDNDVTLRLVVPEHMQNAVTHQYHDKNGHMGIDKTYDSLRQKYFWSNMYKDLYEYISKCVTCQERSARSVKPPVQETDIPLYQFAKIGLDLSGPYPQTLSGNKYIISFIDLYSGWPEAFAVPDKSAENIAHLLIEEIFPRHGAALQIITDNGSENVNRTIKETLEALNISHVCTSYYNPAGNAKVERFHRTLHDILSKKLSDNFETWDLHLNQTLAAVRFHINDSTKYSPFFLLYNRDVVLPIDNLLKPRRKYQGEDLHKIALQRQHKVFTMVHRHMKKAKKSQAKYANKNRQDINFGIGDAVYYRNHKKHGKLDRKWHPYYRIIEKKSPVTFVIRNQLDGNTVPAHAQHLKKANIETWTVPVHDENRQLRRAAYVVPPQESESEDEEEQAEDRQVKFCRKERADSDEEDDIPLMELTKRIRSREKPESDEEHSNDMAPPHVETPSYDSDEEDSIDMEPLQNNTASYDNQEPQSDQMDIDESNIDYSDNEMSINEVQNALPEIKIANDQSNDTKIASNHMTNEKSITETNDKVKLLLEAIVGML